jgi:hypothetical protein
MDFMKETVHQNHITNLRRYWRFFLPLTLILALMMKFPLRIALRESFFDALFYGTISLMCVAAAIYVYRRFSKTGLRLIAVILLCSFLSGWQIFDLVILRHETTFVFFGFYESPDYDGFAYYGLHFRNDDILCHVILERYFGNYLVAITLEINREASWYSCGG